MSNPAFETQFTASPRDIDQLGHVNNAVWVRWIQDVSTLHWERAASRQHQDRYFWVVVRHEIDYLRSAKSGDSIRARTWVGDAPRGARFTRFVEFLDRTDKVCVRSQTEWAIIDNALGRPVRVPFEVVAPFICAE